MTAILYAADPAFFFIDPMPLCILLALRFVRRMPVPMPVSKGLALPAQRSELSKGIGLRVFQSSIIDRHLRIVSRPVYVRFVNSFGIN